MPFYFDVGFVEIASKYNRTLEPSYPESKKCLCRSSDIRLWFCSCSYHWFGSGCNRCRCCHGSGHCSCLCGGRGCCCCCQICGCRFMRVLHFCNVFIILVLWYFVFPFSLFPTQLQEQPQQLPKAEQSPTETIPFSQSNWH